MSSLFPQQVQFAQRRLGHYENARPDVIYLALLVSPARKIEPALIRRLRLKFANYFPGQPPLTVGTESALWFSTLIESRGSDSLTLLPGVVDLLRRRLVERHGELLEPIREIILECHQSIPPVIKWEEDLVYYSLSTDGGDEELRQRILRAAKTILDDEERNLEEWVNRMSVRVPEELLKHDDFKNLLALAQARVVKPKVLTPAESDSSADTIVLIKRRENEISLGTNLEEADFQIGVPKTNPVTLIAWNAADPNDKQSYLLTPNEPVIVPFDLTGSALFLQTTDRRIYQILTAAESVPTPLNTVPNITEQSSTRRLNEVKMVVLGDSGVGKTTLVKRLLTDSFSPESATSGIQTSYWELPINGETLRIAVWDFGGQQIMHDVMRIFLSGQNLYLLVIDPRFGDFSRSAEAWLRLIQNFVGEASVLLVLSKINSSFGHIDTGELEQKYPMIKSVIKTDVKDGIGIADLRDIIRQTLVRMESSQVVMSAEGFAIKDALAHLKEDYITTKQYEKICEENNLSGKADQNTLAQFLHDHGVILRIGDDASSSGVIILNPGWLVNGIYDIINSRAVISRQGELQMSDLSEILSHEEYPPQVYRLLLSTMEKFELCFALPGSENRYLIPILLYSEPPVKAAEFNLLKHLDFEYHYETLPSNLIPRLIVRLHNYIADDLYWREGMIIHFADNRALIRADRQQQKITIAVAGYPPERRVLLDMIRKELNELHLTYFPITVTQKVPLPDYPDYSIDYEKLVRLEESGIPTSKEFVGDAIVEVNVRELLDLVSAVPRGTENPPAHERKIRVYCSYAQGDKKLYAEFREDWASLIRDISMPGVSIEVNGSGDASLSRDLDWVLRENIENADLVLLFITLEFTTSKWCEREMNISLEQYELGKTVIIPVIINRTDWMNLPIAKHRGISRKVISVNLNEKTSLTLKAATRHILKEVEHLLSGKNLNFSDLR
jgi:internalin A